jgi:alkylhydroperoxidase family enzyme
MTLDHAAMGEDDIQRMRRHFDDDQIVEIASVIGLFNYLNRFAETMGVWPTRPGEGGPADDGA